MRRMLLLAVGVMACAEWLRSAPITVLISGTVTQVPVDSIYQDINAGAIFEGSFTFDPDAADLIPASNETGSYAAVGSPYGMTVTIAGHTFTADSISIGILNGAVDQYTVFATNAARNLALEIFLEDATGGALSSALPLPAPQLSLFPRADFHLYETNNGDETQVDGQLGTLGDVPEPSTGVLLTPVVALLALRLARGSKSHRST